MKDDHDDWSTGQFESVATFVASHATDCPSWDNESAPSEWSEGKFESVARPIAAAIADSAVSAPTATKRRIKNETELAAKRHQLICALDRLAQLRTESGPDEFAVKLCAHCAGVARLQQEVLDHLTRPAGNAS